MTEEVNNHELTVVSKVSKAMALIHGVDKDGKNSFQHYDFQSESAIKHAVKGAIETVGIVIIPSYEVLQQYDRTTQKGALNHFVDVMGTFQVKDGTSSITGTMPGSGQDTGEKAMAKACTSAQKYFYKQLFNITDRDEDPDSDNSAPDGGYQTSQKTRHITSNELIVLEQLVSDYAKQLGLEDAKAWAWVLGRTKSSTANVKDLSPQEAGQVKLFIKQNPADKVLKMMREKREKEAK